MKLLVALGLLFFGAPASYFLEKFRKNMGAWSAFVFLLISTCLLLSHSDSTQTYPWLSSVGLKFELVVDGFSLPVAILVTSTSALVALYSKEYMKDKKHLSLYYFLLLVFSGAMAALVFSADFIQFYVFWELMVIPAYFFIALWGTRNPKKIAFKFFIFMHVAAAFVLLGILWLNSYVNTFNMYEMANLIHLVPEELLPIIVGFMVVGFAIKMAIFPLHSWLPDAHSEAPAPISALLSGVMIKTGAYALIRIFSLFPAPQLLIAILSVLVSVTIIYGGLLAMIQNDVKRLLAYSSISQMGYIGLAAISGPLGLAGGVFQIINHGITKSLLFLAAGSLIHASGGERNMSRLGGLLKLLPVTAFTFILAAISLTGAPPLNLFSSEWIIFLAGFEYQQLVPTIIAILTTLLTAAYMLWAINRIFFGTASRHVRRAKESPVTMLIPLLILGILILSIGIWPSPIINRIGVPS